MTPAQKFAAWLGPAMRRAGLDIDRQQGGGRAKLADACGVSRSTVGRWLDGQTIPSPEYFEVIAATLGVPITEMLVGAGIVSSPIPERPAAAARQQSVEEVAAGWDIAPEDVPILRSVVDELRKRSRRRIEASE